MSGKETNQELRKRRKQRKNALALAARGAPSSKQKDSAKSNDDRSRKDGKRSRLPETILGSKHVKALEKVVGSLRDESAVHGNRQLFLDDVFIVYLLAYFNPVVRTLRTMEDLSLTSQAQKHLSIRKICKSTLSDFNKLVDPQRLQPIVDALRERLDRKLAGNPVKNGDLDSLLQQIVAVDGTFLPALAEVTWAVANSNNHGVVRFRARVDARINIDNWVPEAIVIPEPGESEADSAIRHLQPGKIYLYDRGYMSFALLKAHYDSSKEGDAKQPPSTKSHFVARYRTNPANSPQLTEVVDQALTDEDRQAGVISDRIGFFRSANARHSGLKEIPLREVRVPYEDNGQQKTLRLITNLMDVSASTIALLYQRRWQVELFFRWFKSVGNFAHLISHSPKGALTHLYVTIIGVMLMYLHTGYRPSKYMVALMGQVANGAATLEEIITILRERERRCELDRLSAAKRRAKKKAEGR